MPLKIISCDFHVFIVHLQTRGKGPLEMIDLAYPNLFINEYNLLYMKICDNTRLPPCCWTCQPKLENEELFIEELSGLEDIQQRNKAFRNTQKNRHKDQCKTTERTRVSLTSRCKKNKHRSVQSSPRHKVVEDCYQSIKPHINEFNQTKTVRVTHFNQP